MKRTIIVITTILFLFGCNLMNTPSGKVEDYLSKYISLDEEVITDLETTIVKEGLSSENKEIYRKVLLRQYENLKYEIKDESINGDKAEVIVKISVYDLHKVDLESLDYMNQNIDEFSDVNHNFDNDYYNNYRLNKMLNTNELVEYDIKFKLTKKDNEWIIDELDRDSLEKIHGLYNYSNN